MQLIAELNHIIAERSLLKHSFYQAWSKGELSIANLQKYAAEYYHQVNSFPRFISRVHTHCPVSEAQKVLLKNLIDEQLHGKDHPALWHQFAKGLNVSETMMNELPIAETSVMVDKFYELAERNWQDGLCALYAYESQVPDVSASKIAGLKRFYGITDENTLEFFTAHQVYDVEHANEVALLIDKYASPERALQATREAADALWGFLDGMCRIGQIACH